MPHGPALDRVAWWAAPWYRNVARDIAAARSTGAALEVGGGSGRLAVELARLAPGLRLTCTDVDDDAVAHARVRLERAGLGDRVRVERADVAALPYADGSFDLVVSLASLHHWADPSAGLAEIHRVLGPGGTALIFDLTRRIRRLERDGLDLAALAASSPFGGGTLRRLRWPWRLALLVRLELRTAAGGAAVSPGGSAAEGAHAGSIAEGAPSAAEAPRAAGERSHRRVRAYVGLGANVGDTRATLTAAVRALAALPGARLHAVSSLYRTRPVGGVEQADFDNAVVALDVPAGPDPERGALALLAALKSLERALGRLEGVRWGPRALDLDLLVFGRAAVRVTRTDAARSLDPARSGVQWLDLPHPEARRRLFVLAPLAEIAPGLRPPGWGESVVSARRRQEGIEGAGSVRRVARWRPTDGWVDLTAPESSAAELEVSATRQESSAAGQASSATGQASSATGQESPAGESAGS